MNSKSRFVLVVTVLLSFLISVPTDSWAAPPATGQRAGEVSRLIPAVEIARSGKTLFASVKTVVD